MINHSFIEIKNYLGAFYAFFNGYLIFAYIYFAIQSTLKKTIGQKNERKR